MQRATANVREYGAAGDGVTNDRIALQRALDACGLAGGGVVVLSAGVYLSGALRLYNDVRLVLERGAILRGSSTLGDYEAPADEVEFAEAKKGRWHRALLRVENVHGVRIEGEGIIDGNSVRDPEGEEQQRGPHTIFWNHASDCEVRGLTFRDSGNYAMLALDTQRLAVQGVAVTGGWDGFHARRCKSVSVTGCHFSTGDDCIAGGHLEDAVFRDCRLNSSCNAVRIIGPSQRLSVCDCEIIGPGEAPHITQSRYNSLAAILFQPGAWGQTPGVSDQVTFSRLRIRGVQTVLHVALRPGCSLGRFVAEDINATDVYGPACSIENWNDAVCGDASLRRFHVEHTLPRPADPTCHRHARDHHLQTSGEAGELTLGVRPLPAWAFYARNIDRLALEDVELRRPARADVPALRFEGCRLVTQERVAVQTSDCA